MGDLIYLIFVMREEKGENQNGQPAKEGTGSVTKMSPRCPKCSMEYQVPSSVCPNPSCRFPLNKRLQINETTFLGRR